MDLNLKGEGLFVFSDPGGAKPILSYVRLFHEDEYLIITDRKFDFITDYDLKVLKLEKVYLDLIVSIIENFEPKFVFCGTSYTSNIELRFIQAANKLGIPTISYIDHYTRYLDRFLFNGKYIFPNRIFLTDERAFRIALNFKLEDQVSIQITGNFHHMFLNKWKPIISKAEFFTGFRLNGDEKIILFAPDPLSNVGGREKYGFDETDVWNIIDEVISKIPSNKYKIFLQMHPNQDLKYFKCNIKNKYKYDDCVANNLHTNTLIYYADIVVGMYSSFLIEANQFKKNIIRYLPNGEMEDALEGMNIGEVANNENQLLNLLNKF
jgi:hypothetical protein